MADVEVGKLEILERTLARSPRLPREKVPALFTEPFASTPGARSDTFPISGNGRGCRRQEQNAQLPGSSGFRPESHGLPVGPCVGPRAQKNRCPVRADTRVFTCLAGKDANFTPSADQARNRRGGAPRSKTWCRRGRVPKGHRRSRLVLNRQVS